MSKSETQNASWSDWISPLRLTLLAINAVCFGGCVILLALGSPSGPLVLLTIGVALSFGAGLVGAIACITKKGRYNSIVSDQPEQGDAGAAFPRRS